MSKSAIPRTGIQEAMRLELKAVEAAIRVRLASGGSLEEVTQMNLVPADTPGRLPLQSSSGKLIQFVFLFFLGGGGWPQCGVRSASECSKNSEKASQA